ncbi:2-amino-4-hydroxy-6-hydroxymethyldihydropteridine diphosphokinase [Mariprofundus erugo]|uniref:2-amino-4-hydroxy-6-hydroxymethyldihydropteridine pyrophosphokinase n=1 Tax=Mariprofundus erugo TaxID=2528639 RepID=A0A5R9GW93_9PROT|nr:2-amino-4-hydroxy-6-hydroxymethyldihydropteridine diphosphokinase [Mariprofundus erugo]TLS69145.1 2-amino-4-hydroxy-6-hydroxymethyldihydropteridine diphosphokinase [Mariprofundus erugo]
MNEYLIALGGNLGDAPATLRRARTAIAALPDTSVTASSLLYRTPPIGPPGQPDYYNAVIAVTTALSPLSLLDALQAIENCHGRVRLEHWGARTLDLDIIAMGTQIIEQPRLIVPHPYMHCRQFVLRPLCDIQPQWHHPLLGKSATSLLATVEQDEGVALTMGEIW